MPRVILEISSEIRLRSAQLADAPALFGVIRANIDHLEPWLPEMAEVKSVADVHDWIEPQIDAKIHENEIVFLIEVEGQVCGVVNVHSLDLKAATGELGYWISGEHSRKGIVTRCCATFLDYCIGTLGLIRIEATMIPNNIGSRAVVERLGFNYDGLRVRPPDAKPVALAVPWGFL